MFPERKCQFSSHKDISAVFRFRYVFCKRIFNILVESMQRKQTDDGFVHHAILTKLKHQETELVNEIISMDFQNNSPRKFVYEFATPAAGTTCKVIKFIFHMT